MLYKILRLRNKLRGNKETVIGYYFTFAVIFYIFICKITINFNPQKLDKIFSSEIASLAGIFIGLLISAFGIIASTDNAITKKFTELGYISVVYKVNRNTIVVFLLSLVFYILKLFISNSFNEEVLLYNFPIYNITINLGMFFFVFGLVLLNTSVRYFKYIY